MVSRDRPSVFSGPECKDIVFDQKEMKLVQIEIKRRLPAWGGGQGTVMRRGLGDPGLLRIPEGSGPPVCSREHFRSFAF
jgi:hypothetical protein